MLGAIGKALGQCLSGAFLATLAKAFAVTLALLAGLSWLLLWAVGFLPDTPWSWLNTALGVLESIGALFAVLLLAVPVAMMAIGIFLDEVALKVERRYYPDVGAPRRVPLTETLTSAAGLAGLALLLNLMALPAYLFLPGLNLAIYFVLNGSLIGREYYLLVAQRRLAPEEARALRQKKAPQIFLAGGLVALMLLIPGVNLVAPLFGTALMVHLVEALRKAYVAQPFGGDALPARASDNGNAHKLPHDRGA